MNQNPFSFYDFLGYLIPGGFFILLIYFCGLIFDLDILIDLRELLRGQSQIFGILNYASIVIITYIAGHFISITSAFFIEKYMNKKLGYPSIYLFNKLTDTSEKVCCPSCDELNADKKNKNKEPYNQLNIIPYNTMGLFNTKTMLFSILAISFG